MDNLVLEIEVIQLDFSTHDSMKIANDIFDYSC